jgi:hypothetical protein
VSDHPRRRPSLVARLAIVLATFALLAPAMPLFASPVLAAPDGAGAIASGFQLFKYPTPQPLCNGLGLNVSGVPFFGSGDCGFETFAITGAPTTADVDVALIGPDGSQFATTPGAWDDVNGNWTFDIDTAAGWPAGWITAVVSVDGQEAGSNDVRPQGARRRDHRGPGRRAVCARR